MRVCLSGRRHMLSDRNPPIRATARPCAHVLRRYVGAGLAARARRIMGCIAADQGIADGLPDRGSRRVTHAGNIRLSNILQINPKEHSIKPVPWLTTQSTPFISSEHRRPPAPTVSPEPQCRKQAQRDAARSHALGAGDDAAARRCAQIGCGSRNGGDAGDVALSLSAVAVERTNPRQTSLGVRGDRMGALEWHGMTLRAQGENAPRPTIPSAGLPDIRSPTLAYPSLRSDYPQPVAAMPCRRRVLPAVDPDPQAGSRRLASAAAAAHTTSPAWRRKGRAAASAPRLPPALMLRLQTTQSTESVGARVAPGDRERAHQT
ncbi:hypothetical protein VC83_01545 [Pseudogymnoascus destructans]|uniref:Uncharacterized protein n=1 Tax=Pseudogymnoascus destructans TaxID=655981 RepID=A0A177AIS8_9PEZI|nr:uncharacterized protein VC83_01545 [Pseudogymnoascus destructans]OAF61969.1 hypothetical protein VC83_01545 [Pseudogymnoascus destructans]